MKMSSQKQVSAVKPKMTVASVFNQDSDDEPEEMPPEAKMRMRNFGRCESQVNHNHCCHIFIYFFVETPPHHLDPIRLEKRGMGSQTPRKCSRKT